MAKKITIAAIVLVILGVVFMPEWTLIAYRQAIKPENRGKDWAPMMAYRVARVNMRFWRYSRAGAMLKNAYETWPKEAWHDEAHYQIAMCYEKSGNDAKAVEWYKSFIKAYPNHVWSDQAKRRIALLESES